MSEFGFNEYQTAAIDFAVFPEEAKLTYPLMGLAEETGELIGKFAKHFRGDKPYDIEAVKKEAGDVLWMLSAVLTALDVDLEEVAMLNLEKLSDRQRRDVLRGCGDDR